MLRKEGIESIKLDGLEMKLGTPPVQYKTSKSDQKMPHTASLVPGGVTEETEIVSDTLSPDQLLFYSAVDHSELFDKN